MAAADPLRAFEQTLMEENRRRLASVQSTARPARRRGYAPIAPIPADPAECRWCHGQLRALLDDEPADHCDRGCAKSDAHPYRADCSDCGREFETGERRATTCFECWRKDQAENRVIAATTPRFHPSRRDNQKWDERRREQRRVG